MFYLFCAGVSVIGILSFSIGVVVGYIVKTVIREMKAKSMYPGKVTRIN